MNARSRKGWTGQPHAMFCAFALLCALGCDSGTDAHNIRVDLRTDLVADVEFDSVRIEFGDGDLAESQDRLNRAADDYLRGQRIGSADVPPGPLPITVTLFRSLRPVLARRVVTQIQAAESIVTMVISRSCAGVECPNDDPALDSCLGGRCVDPLCTVETPEFCPPEMCSADSECGVPACADPRCSDGVCFALPVDARCEAGFRCDGTLGCVPVDPVRDAGPDAMPDSGSDAGTDAGITDVGAPDTFDAGPGTGPFGPAIPLSSLTAGGTEADDPTLTADLLQIFFKSERPGSRVWTARRSALGEPFGAPVRLDELLPGEDATSPELSHDGLTLHFSASTTAFFEIYRTTRPNLDASFSTGTRLSELVGASSLYAFVVNGSQTIGVLSRAGRLYETRRASVGATWGSATSINELNRTGSEIDAHLSADGRVIYFAGNDPSDASIGTEIWRAERPNVDADFGPAERIDSVSSVFPDTDPWVSEDERVMVYMTWRDGRQQLYAVTRDGGVF